MNDSSAFENGEPVRRNKKLPLLLILLAVVLGIVIWRVRHAGEARVSAPQDTTQVAESAKPAEAPKVESPAPATPETTVSAVPTPVPVVKPKHKHKPMMKPVKKPSVAAEPPASTPAVVKTIPPKTEPKAEVFPKAEPAPKPKVTESPKAAAAPAPKVAASAPKTDKKFAMEDQPMPEKPALSEEGRLALNTLPKEAESKPETPAPSVSSPLFKQGMDAYRKHDYAGAIKLLSQLPKPATKQRGDVARDEYVDGNFSLGVSLLKSDRAADAVEAFNTVLEYEKYYPLANMNLGICYVDLKQYSKANKAFEAVTRDQSLLDPALFDDVMQRTKYFWALAWTRMYKSSKDPDKQAYYQQQAVMRWRDYQTWFGKNEKYRSENRKAEDYIKSLSTM